MSCCSQPPLSQPRPRNKERAAILIISLWMLAILSMLAIGIGHRLSLEIRLLHNQLDSSRALYIAKAGIERVALERAKVIKSGVIIYADGFHQPWMNNEPVFKDIKFGDGFYTVENPEYPSVYGASDEQARININKASPEILKNLLKQITNSDDTAESIAACIIDWRDTDSDVTIGAENDYYRSLETPYNCKNADFDSIEELLFVKGITADIFSQIKGYVTIYGNGSVNINTASRTVLVSVLGEKIADYILNFRSGSEGKLGERWFIATDDTVAIDVAKTRNIHSDVPDTGLGDSDEESGTLWNKLKTQETAKIIGTTSNAFRINSVGQINGIKSSIDAVIEFVPEGGYKYLSWQQK